MKNKNTKKLLIKNGLLYTMADGTAGPMQGDILLEGGRIQAVGATLTAPGAQMVDAQGLCVLPGLIDAHSHIGIIDFGVHGVLDDANEMTAPITASVDAVYSTDTTSRDFCTCRENGVTTLMITPGSGNVVCGRPFIMKTGNGPLEDEIMRRACALKVAFGGNPKGTYGSRGQEPMTRMGVAKVLRETLRAAKEYDEKRTKGDEVPYDAELEAMRPAVRGEVPLKMHCTQHDILAAIDIAGEFGLPFTLEHAWGAGNYLDEIVASGGDVCYGPIGTYRSPGERRLIDIEAVKILDERGVRVALATDAPFVSVHCIYHHIGEAVRAGVDYYRALRMVTCTPAAIMGIEKRVGSLEANKDADVVLFRHQPGLDTDAAVLCTIIGGQVVYSHPASPLGMDA